MKPNEKPSRSYIVINPRNGKIGELIKSSWFGPTIFLNELPDDDKLSNHEDEVIYSDQPEVNEFIEIGVI